MRGSSPKFGTIEHGTGDESRQGLLEDWSKSEENLGDRLIIAVKNSDVAALNHGARQYLKVEGLLSGEEIAVGGNHYMKGDRILIKETNKEIGLVNGDFATVIEASKERFIINVGMEEGTSDIVNDNSKRVEFNPAEYRGFRHGYATTVYKAQGASIKDVYVYHDGFAGVRNSYVALSRHIKNLRLYINNEATRSVDNLIKQLGHDPEIGSSLSYLAGKELKSREIKEEFARKKTLVGGLVVEALEFVSKQVTAIADKHIPASEYYNYRTPELKREKVEAVLDMVGSEAEREAAESSIESEELAVVGGNTIVNNSRIAARSGSIMSGAFADKFSGFNRRRQTAKERFYAKADYVRKASNKVGNDLAQKAKWDEEAERLRAEVKYKSEAIARDLLGEPNKSLSNGRTLRYGEHGRMAVRISGERMGSWYDFSREKGGDMFSLVQDSRGCEFKEAAEYLRRSVGMEASSNSNLQLVHDHRNKDLTKDYIKAKAEEKRINKAKAEQVEKLYSRSKAIGNRSVAFKYLTEIRGLEFDISISDNIRTAGIYVGGENINIADDIVDRSKKGKYFPAIVAFAKDSEGKITGGQQIFLNKSSGKKADINIPKKSFGKIAGSYVDVGVVNTSIGEAVNNSEAKEEVTIIAEGLETALSIKQGLSEHSNSESNNEPSKGRILCSLGISNIKNYEASKGEKLIIAADNDGIDSFSNKTIENAKAALEEKGAYVEIVRPEKEGDFNDVLESEGSKTIFEAFEPALTKHTARTLEEYFGKDIGNTSLDKNDKSNLAYIEKYDLAQGSIVNAYRKGNMSGKLELEQVRKGLELAVNHFGSNKEILEEASQWGYKYDEKAATRSMIGMGGEQCRNHCVEIRDSVLGEYLNENLSKFALQKGGKFDIESIKPIMVAEQGFLKKVYESLQTPINEQNDKNKGYLEAGKVASESPQRLEEIFILANSLVTEIVNHSALQVQSL